MQSGTDPVLDAAAQPGALTTRDGTGIGGFFPPDSELAERIRTFDWAATSLGPIEGWPRSLLTTVGIMLNTQCAMFLFWGPDHLCLYNDSYRPSLGGQMHPGALGQPGEQCWHDIWHIIGGQIASVMADGAHTWFEDQLVPFDRNGYFEEIYFTYSYSPVFAEDGRVGGTLVICSETTGQVLGERRWATLQQLAAVADDDLDLVIPELLAATDANTSDVPFALLYGMAQDDGTARLVGASGFGAAGVPAALCSTGPRSGLWAPAVAATLATATPTEQELDAGMPLPTGPWPEPVRQVVVHPVAAGDDPAAYLLVLAASGRKRLDPTYRRFYDLVAAQYAAAIARGLRRSAERERVEMLAELDRAKTGFLSTVSHELRTPLTLISAPIEAMLARTEPGPDREELEIAHRNTRRLLKLVNALLDFSQLQAGRLRADPEPTDVAALTAECVAAFGPIAAAAGLDLTWRCPEPVVADVDRDMWEKVVLNLVSNALKYTRSGAVTVGVRRDAGDALLTVSDTGIGIVAQELPRIFERFRRVAGDTGRSIEGTGIGLALVAEFVAMAGGRVDVASEPGTGSTFTVRVPAVTDPARVGDTPVRDVGPTVTDSLLGPFLDEAVGWVAQAGAEVAAAGDGETARLLVVDDSADMRRYLARVLAPVGQVSVAVDGQDALAQARAQRPDLIVSDVMMPGLSGTELVRAIRGEAVLADVPVILLSARAGHDAVIEGIDAGAVDYLAKPFSIGELRSRVRANIDAARLRRARDRDSARHLAQITTVADLTSRLNAAGSLVEVAAVVSGPLAASLGADHGAVEFDSSMVPDGDRQSAVVPFGKSGSGAAGWLVLHWPGPRVLDRTESVLLQTVGNALAQAVYRAREYDREHLLAVTLQQALLPARPPSLDWVDVAWTYQAASAGTLVGGDWFDVVERENGTVAVVIGDVVGHGLVAAAVMSEMRHATRVFLAESASPAAALERLNRLALANEESYATVACVVLDPVSRTATYSLAGHPPPMRRRGRVVDRLNSGLGTPIGVAGHGFHDAVVDLLPGDLLLLYTDGLIERRDRGLLLDELATWLADSPALDAGELARGVTEAMLDSQRDDDTAVIALAVRG